MSTGTAPVGVIGAGIGGLCAAIDLAVLGYPVTVFERAGAPGGKMRQLAVDGALIDAGPTVFTLRGIFDDLFEAAGTALDRELTVRQARTLARHAWAPDQVLDLHADIDRSADAIGRFAGAAEARRFEAFCARAEAIHKTLDVPFMRSAAPSPLGLVGHHGLSGLGALWRIAPFTRLWDALGTYFHDPRLRQLFGRYATYTGSSPFLAPATLMLIAHVEQAGVWYIDGGMHRLAQALADCATRLGVTIHYDAHVTAIGVRNGHVDHIALANGETVPVSAAVVNADAAAIASGAFGPDIQRAVPRLPPRQRSLSAVTWAIRGQTEGLALCRHTVLFSGDYPREFAALHAGSMPDDPTVYICAQDRGDADDPARDGPERLFCLINAPASGDTHPFDNKEIASCAQRMTTRLARCGLTIDADAPRQVTTPADFHALFPATGGALYGRASHGWRASFQRPLARTKLAGLYLAGGSTHPGAGVPMAALSGRLAARCLATDRVSTGSFHPVAIPGGISTR